MQFTEFLIEKSKETTRAMLILHKIIDMVDHGHVEYSSDKIVINVGKLIKDSDLYDLDLIIRKGSSHSVRLGKNKTTGKIAIVIENSRLPERQNIDTFLSKNKNMDKFLPIFQKYLTDHHVSAEEKGLSHSTAYEKSREMNNKKSFEVKYKELVEKIKETMEEYNSAKRDIERQISSSGSVAQKQTLNIALNKLKKESIGSTVKEFTSKMLALADSDFINHLDKDFKKKLISRLQDMYEHNI